jgi:hypothetical protein
MLGTYDIAWANAGAYGYTRQYFVYNNAPGNATSVDPSACVYIRQHPDSVGNLNSPLATVYEQGSFVSGLVEMAFTAELARSQPAFVTQIRKAEKYNDLTAGGLFFDAESRQQQSGQETEESQLAARALEMQSQLARAINKVQTHGGAPNGSASKSFGVPEVPPKLFTLPKGAPASDPRLAVGAVGVGVVDTPPFRFPTHVGRSRVGAECPGAPATRRPRGPHAPQHRPVLCVVQRAANSLPHHPSRTLLTNMRLG